MILPKHMDQYAGQVVDGEVVAGEFVGTGDEEGRDPGVYITIKLKDEQTALVGGPVQVTYMPLPDAPIKPDPLPIAHRNCE